MMSFPFTLVSGTYCQPGSSQQLQKEGVRLASFKDFPTSVPVYAIRLAQAGFYYTGKRDVVRCFCCGVTHGGWRMGDKPTSVHALISPNCPLVRGNDRTNIPLSSSPRFLKPQVQSAISSAARRQCYQQVFLLV
ncbi:hypothetical protein V1264_016424 [Littorina saxatilis]|uniref:Uncharacterized protein n=1 Tax=Littorina saxatilis TaxID=31220 RepID=A0AAN9BP34_9CAEN